MNPRARRLVMAAAAAAWLLVVAATSSSGAAGPQVRVILRPAVAKLGERVTYRVEVIGWTTQPVDWMAPDSSSQLTWGEPRHGSRQGQAPKGQRFGPGARSGQVAQPTPDTAWIEVPLQAFQLGVVPIPGIGFRYERLARSSTPESGMAHAPTARLIVVPLLTAADSNATLRPMHGPLAAPWWERVPWRWVTLGLVALLLAWLAVRAWRRRRRVTPSATPAAVPLSPAAQALAALAALRALDLPRQERYAEHAFRLGQILRRYLEATVPATHPGHTTPELVRHLGEAGLSAGEVQRLAGLLRVWDRVKFAREPFTFDEAQRAEEAVESYVRRAAGRSSEEAA